MALTPEEIAELNKLTLEEIELKKQRNELDAQELAYLDEKFAKRQKNAASISDEIKALQAYQKQLENIGASIDGNLLKRQVARDILEKELDLLHQKIKNGEVDAKTAMEQVKAREKQLASMDKVLDVQKEMNKNLRQTTSLVQAAEKAGIRLGLAMQNPTLALGEMNVGFQKLGGMLTGKFIGGFVSMITEFDNATKSFERQFAVGEEYKDGLNSIFEEQRKLGVSMEDITKATGALITSFTDFTMLAPAQREEIAATATMMKNTFGVANEDFTKGIQFSTKMMGMGASEAAKFQEEIAATAQALGRSPQELSAQFAQMGPQLAKFGLEGGKTFKELARLSKITGMEMGKILAVTNKFDTFEGAATQAGQLNAALGGNFVNAMDLMMATDPAERFQMIRDAILDTGLSFDTMSYYQKQFYTNALGLSEVGDLALMLQGNTDLMTDAGDKNAASYVEQAKRAQELMTIQQKLESIFVESADQVQYFAEMASDLATKLQENADIIFFLTKAYVVYQLGVAAVNVARGVMMVKDKLFRASKVTELAQIKSITGALRAQTKAQNDLNRARNRGNKIPGGGGPGAIAGGLTAKSILAIGGALIGLGLGFMAAGKGVAFMAEAMQDMSIGQILAMGVPIAALGISFKALAVGLAAVTIPAGAASPPLLALGGAVTLIGGGIGLAAAGIGFMAEGFSLLFDAIDLKKMVAFAGFVGSLVLGAIFMAKAGVGLALMAGGMFALMLSLKLIATADLEAIATFTESLASTSASDMAAVTKQIKAIANAIDEIDTDKSITFDAVLRQTALTATAVAAANRTAPATATAGGARMSATPAATGGRGKIGEVLIKFDTDLFENKVISIYEEQDGRFAAEAMD